MNKKNLSATAHLSKHDPVLRKLILKVKLGPLSTRKNHFQSLSNFVISQQLSVKAASTIQARFASLFGKSQSSFPTPEEVLKMPIEKMRTAGLSGAKARYIHNIASAIHLGLLDMQSLMIMSDEEVIRELTAIVGIGRWTAEMFLLFSLARPNVFSVTDAGLRGALKKWYAVDPVQQARAFKKLLDSWHPYASTASRYLWKSLELENL